MRLTSLECIAFVTAFEKGEDVVGAALAVTKLGRIAWPEYGGPFPKDDLERIAEFDAVTKARADLAREMFAAVKAENELQAKDEWS